MLYNKARNFFKTFKTLKFNSAVKYYLLKYFSGHNSKLHYFHMRNGLKLMVNKVAGDLTTLFEIFINSDYAMDVTTESEFNILDIGANVGYYSLFANKIYPKAKIYSFEPFPETFLRFQENISNNNCKNIYPFQLAVSDFNGTSDFFSFEWAGCNTMINRNFDEGYYKTTTVDCIKFDDILRISGVKEFLFGKIDCEGSEYRIFLNSKDESIRAVKNYIIEVHNDKEFSRKDLVKRFTDLGYIVKERENLIEASYGTQSYPVRRKKF